jgi:hypothetical protein
MIVLRNKIIKQKDITCILTELVITTDGNGTQKEAEKKKPYEFMSRDTTNVKHEMFVYTGNTGATGIVIRV